MFTKLPSNINKLCLFWVCFSRMGFPRRACQTTHRNKCNIGQHPELPGAVPHPNTRYYPICFWVRFLKTYFPRRALKRTPKIVKSQNVRIFTMVQWFYPFPYANSMQKTSPMHLNTSPTCFEWPRDRKPGFRDPGPEKRNPIIYSGPSTP